MIACTKLFVIDDVRLVIFSGALNFINLPCWLRSDLSESVVRNCCTISGLSPFASRHFVVCEREDSGSVNATFRSFLPPLGPPALMTA